MSDPEPTEPAALDEHVVGRVIGTDVATPLEFWVGVAPGQFLQLDDVVALDRSLPAASRSRCTGS